MQATLLASIPILAAMLPGDALNCVYSGACSHVKLKLLYSLPPPGASIVPVSTPT